MNDQIANRACRWLLPLDSTKLCSAALRRTGLQDFGEPPLEPALSVLVGSLESEANLGPVGRFLMWSHLRDLLETRLRLVEAWKRDARRNAERIEKPVFIVGMPRSGSTFQHELLAEIPVHRAPRVWEVMYPLASAAGGQSDRVRRIRKTAVCLWWFRRLAPLADSVYPMRATTPHECLSIHSYTFLSAEFIVTCQLPAYQAFFQNTCLTPAYTWERQFLEHLQRESPGKRWILKSPDHVYGLEELFAVFPDARIIQTHRDPMEVLNSLTRLKCVLRGLYGPIGHHEEMRARETKALAERAERFLQFRDSHSELEDRFIDIKYTDLIANPMATVRWICERLDSPLTESAAAMVHHLASNRSRYRGPGSSAQPSGVKPRPVLEEHRFQRYCSRFNLCFPRHIS